MNASAWALVRALRGPLMLITFGTLTALNHMKILDFERSYPILIIVYGITKLIERMVAPPIPTAPPFPPNAPPSWHQAPGQPAGSYPPQQFPPVYPPRTPQGGAQ